jgi:geranyl-CoA carboxylase alpha subunit
MLAKVMAWGETREIARHRLINALKDTALFGSTTNKSFLIDVLSRERFAKGEATTAFIAEEFSADDLAPPVPTLAQAAMAAVMHYTVQRRRAQASSLNVSPLLMDWASAGPLATRYVYDFDGGEFDVTVSPRRQGGYIVRHGDGQVVVEVMECGDNTARLVVDGRRQSVLYSAPGAGILDLSIDGQSLHFRNRIAFAASAEETAGGGQVVAPMHGNLLEVLVKPGDQVEIGTRLAVLEAMKMQHDILAEIAGTVIEVAAVAGNQVAADDLLVEIEAPE